MSISLDSYRRDWPRVGGVIAMAVGGATTLAARRLSKRQVLSAANYGALLVHQYEEYVDPGWFPGQFNHGVLKSDTPRHSPLNRMSALCVNVPFAYPYYLVPILFPKSKALGLSPVFFGILQAGAHGVLIPRLAGDKYSPGFLASIFLHVPIGITYIRTVNAEEGITKGDVAKALAYLVGFALVGVVGPNAAFFDEASPYSWDAKQMGHHDVEGSTVESVEPTSVRAGTADEVPAQS